MGIVQAYLSESDGALFLNESEYKDHLHKLAVKKAAVTRQNNRDAKREALITKIAEESTTFDEIAAALKENWLIIRSNTGRSRSKIVEISFHHMQWSNCVSNSHACPKGGVRNWGNDPNLPKGYPGWKGTMLHQVKNDGSLFEQPFDGTGIHIGSGGSGSYGVTLFASDFPGVSKVQIWDMLKV